MAHENSNDFNAKMGRENIFKPIKANRNLHEKGNDHDVRLLTSATSKSIFYEHDVTAPRHS
jgi:hypothetical protein